MKDNKELQNLYEKCMDFWGFEKQAGVIQEECAELIVSASHALRGRSGSMEELLEECTDVYIMINQLIYYLGEDRVMGFVDKKSEKAKNKLLKHGVVL